MCSYVVLIWFNFINTFFNISITYSYKIFIPFCSFIIFLYLIILSVPLVSWGFLRRQFFVGLYIDRSLPFDKCRVRYSLYCSRILTICTIFRYDHRNDHWSLLCEWTCTSSPKSQWRILNVSGTSGRSSRDII